MSTENNVLFKNSIINGKGLLLKIELKPSDIDKYLHTLKNNNIRFSHIIDSKNFKTTLYLKVKNSSDAMKAKLYL